MHLIRVYMPCHIRFSFSVEKNCSCLFLHKFTLQTYVTIIYTMNLVKKINKKTSMAWGLLHITNQNGLMYDRLGINLRKCYIFLTQFMSYVRHYL